MNIKSTSTRSLRVLRPSKPLLNAYKPNGVKKRTSPDALKRRSTGIRSLNSTPKNTATSSLKKPVSGGRAANKGPSHKSADQENRVAGFVTQASLPKNNNYKEFLLQTFLSLRFIKSLPKADAQQLAQKQRVFAPKHGFKRTVIFDLDETLVHCCGPQSQGRPDVVLPIALPDGQITSVKAT